jgi:hypothetical protein
MTLFSRFDNNFLAANYHESARINLEFNSKMKSWLSDAIKSRYKSLK